MKLSDFKEEKAVEVLADIIEPVTEIFADAEFQRMVSTAGVPYLKTATYVLREHPKEVLDMYEPLMREDRAEATPVKLIRLMMDIIGDPEMQSLFSSQSQTEALTPSGSATENTEDGLN